MTFQSKDLHPRPAQAGNGVFPDSLTVAKEQSGEGMEPGFEGLPVGNDERRKSVLPVHGQFHRATGQWSIWRWAYAPVHHPEDPGPHANQKRSYKALAVDPRLGQSRRPRKTGVATEHPAE